MEKIHLISSLLFVFVVLILGMYVFNSISGELILKDRYVDNKINSIVIDLSRIKNARNMRFSNSYELLDKKDWEPFKIGKPWQVAPRAGKAVVFAQFKSRIGQIYEASLSIKVSRQVVFLKADDLGMEKSFKYWDRFLDYIVDKKLRASIGITGKPFGKKTDNYIEMLRKATEDHISTIEFWNHGWSHWGANTGFEFRGSSLDSQIKSFKKTNQLVRDKLGISLITFGAGNNRFDDNTIRALEKVPEIKITFNYSPVNNPKTAIFQLNFSEIIGYDWPEIISFNRFHEVYTRVLKDSAYIVLQIHPASPWNNHSWNEFDKIIEFLKNRDVEFMTPFQYFERISLN